MLNHGPIRYQTQFPKLIPKCRADHPRVTHPFATRAPPPNGGGLSVRLACVKHAASVRPEPGSNSPKKQTKKLQAKNKEINKTKTTNCSCSCSKIIHFRQMTHYRVLKQHWHTPTSNLLKVVSAKQPWSVQLTCLKLVNFAGHQLGDRRADSHKFTHTTRTITNTQLRSTFSLTRPSSVQHLHHNVSD